MNIAFQKNLLIAAFSACCIVFQVGCKDNSAELLAIEKAKAEQEQKAREDSKKWGERSGGLELDEPEAEKKNDVDKPSKTSPEG